MKMKIEEFVSRWNDERPEGFIAMSEKQKKKKKNSKNFVSGMVLI